MGTREFADQSIPWRSRFGNNLTKFIFRKIFTININDTQTGLRAIPTELMHDLVTQNMPGYELETYMLLRAQEMGVPMSEVTIATIYENNNQTSHFNPLLDSMKIYCVFFRFMSASLISAAIDFVLFSLAYFVSAKLFYSMLIARLISATVNYKINRHLTFKDGHGFKSFMKYALLASMVFTGSYCTVNILRLLHINIYLSKILAELIIFTINFSIQKHFVFKSKKP